MIDNTACISSPSVFDADEGRVMPTTRLLRSACAQAQPTPAAPGWTDRAAAGYLRGAGGTRGRVRGPGGTRRRRRRAGIDRAGRR